MRSRLAVLGLVVILTVNARAATEKVLYNFTSGNGGAYPIDFGHLVRDSSGVLYGTTGGGGRCGNGTVFELSHSGRKWREVSLHSFCDEEGYDPNGDVILDASGNIYGTTHGGYPSCTYSCGTVFKLSKAGKLTVLYTFKGGNDGASPLAGVILDKSGNLYGTTYFGGVNNNGVVYEVSSSGKFSVIYTFCTSDCSDGANPIGGLAIDKEGHLYGTTYLGGDDGFGVVFVLHESKGVWSEVVLHSFAGGPSDGAWPEGSSVTLGTRLVGTNKQFLIFGTTGFGGASDCGTVFELVKAQGVDKYQVIYNFTTLSGDGQYPYGSLLLRSGKLFGTTTQGGITSGVCTGSGCGIVFELSQNKQSWTEEILHEFNYSNGNSPLSGVVADPSGNLYGVAYSGGSGCNGLGCGVVFQIIP